MKLRKSHRPLWMQATVVGLAVLSLGVISGCGPEAVQPPVADKGGPGSAPGGVSDEEYGKKMMEMKGGGAGGGDSKAYPGK